MKIIIKKKLEIRPAPDGATLYLSLKKCLYCFDYTDAEENKCVQCGKLFYQEATEEERQESIKRQHDLKNKRS